MKRLAIISIWIGLGLVTRADGPDPETIKKLDLPGVAINLEERCVDITATLCLRRGSLEFVACSKGTKEHESLVVIKALPSHVHTALLLLGAKAGHPAARKLIGKGPTQRFIDIPPTGSPISVSLVVPTKEGEQKERPLFDFISRVDDKEDPNKPEAKKRLKTFLFAGSILTGNEGKPKTYHADRTGSAITLSTFGDGLLCLPGVFGHDNHALQWEADPTHLPKPNTKIILRLRPQVAQLKKSGT